MRDPPRGIVDQAFEQSACAAVHDPPGARSSRSAVSVLLRTGVGILRPMLVNSRLPPRSSRSMARHRGARIRRNVVLYFLLVSGDTFLRRIVEVLPRFRDKRQAMDISQQIQEDISGYLVTITAMNAAVGVATAAAMYLCGRWLSSVGTFQHSRCTHLW
jgi:hypothetical protein